MTAFRCVLIACVMLTGTPPLTAEQAAEDATQLTRQVLDVYARVQAVDAEKREALSDLQDEQNRHRDTLRSYQAPPLSEQKLEQLDEQIARAEQNLERLRRQRTAGTENDPAVRAQRKKQAQAEVDRITAEMRTASEPFEDRKRQIKEAVAAQRDALTAAYQPMFLGGEIEGVTIEAYGVSSDPGSAMVYVNWRDTDGNKVAWSHVRLRPLSEISEHQKKTLLNNRYPISSRTNNTMWLWAGNAKIAFIVEDERWKNSAWIADNIERFIDLKALSEIKPESED